MVLLSLATGTFRVPSRNTLLYFFYKLDPRGRALLRGRLAAASMTQRFDLLDLDGLHQGLG
jgi:hypothetical protein